MDGYRMHARLDAGRVQIMTRRGNVWTDKYPAIERLGAEAMRDLVSSFLAASLAEVDRYGGTAPQFTGDSFMALFGAPVTQEDHV